MFSEITNLANQVGAIDYVKDRLFSKPDKAAEQLAESLDELYKMFKALDVEIVSYLSLNFDFPESLVKGRAILLGMEVGQSKIHMNEARGHCARIKNIYHDSLNGWFNRVFTDQGERLEVKKIFDDIGTADDTIIKAIDVVSDWLTKKAEKTIECLDSGNIPGADGYVKNSRTEVRDDRIALTNAMSQLRSMQADFIRISETV